MAPFTVKTKLEYTYNNSMFRLEPDGKYGAGAGRCSARKRVSEAVKHRAGDAPRSDQRSPDRAFQRPATDRPRHRYPLK